MSSDQPGQPGGGRRSALPLGLLMIIAAGVFAGVVLAALIVFEPFAPERTAGGLVPTTVPQAVTVGEVAPDFTGETASGETIRLSELRGRPVVLNFWATWCAPCEAEMPALQSASQRYEDAGLTILAVNAMEPVERVDEFMTELGLTFPAVLDPAGEILDLYEVRVFPTTVVVDAEGRVYARHFGPLTDEQIDEYMSAVSAPAGES